MVTRCAVLALAMAMAWAFSAGAQEYVPPFYKYDHLYTPKELGKPHGSSMVELDNGDILATWYVATEETNTEAQIMGAVWDKKKWEWGAPRVIIAKEYSKSVGNTALYKDEDGIIWMFFAAVRFGGWSGSTIHYVQSRDGGKTWSPGAKLVGSLGHLPRNNPIPLGGRRMLAPFFIDFWYETNMVGSYTMRIEHKNGEIISREEAHLDDHDAIQPALARLPDGRILMLARDKSSRFVRRSYSADEGKTWAPAQVTDIPNPGAAVSIIYVEDVGAVLMAYNHAREAGNPLSMAFSMDGGVTFTRLPDLAADPENPKVGFTYPTLMQASDGLIHVLWTHNDRESLKHSVFSISWLAAEMKKAEARELSKK